MNPHSARARLASPLIASVEVSNASSAVLQLPSRRSATASRPANGRLAVGTAHAVFVNERQLMADNSLPVPHQRGGGFA